MRLITSLTPILLMTLGLTACQSDNGPARFEQTNNGIILTSPSGHTLYTYEHDHPAENTSSCTGACARLFPPYLVDKESLDYGKKHGFLSRNFSIAKLKENGEEYPIPKSDGWATIRRPDGRLQWTHSGYPLYFYQSDALVGDRNGSELYGVWHVATPQNSSED